MKLFVLAVVIGITTANPLLRAPKDDCLEACKDEVVANVQNTVDVDRDDLKNVPKFLTDIFPRVIDAGCENVDPFLTCVRACADAEPLTPNPDIGNAVVTELRTPAHQRAAAVGVLELYQEMCENPQRRSDFETHLPCIARAAVSKGPTVCGSHVPQDMRSKVQELGPEPKVNEALELFCPLVDPLFDCVKVEVQKECGDEAIRYAAEFQGRVLSKIEEIYAGQSFVPDVCRISPTVEN